MHKPLAEFADIFYGKSPSEVLDEEGLVPVFGTGGTYAKAVRALFSGPAVVLPRKGSLGSPHYSEGAFWPSDTTFAAIPKDGVDAKWLFYQLLCFELEKLNEATGVPSISRDWLAKIDIPDQRGEVPRLVRRVIEALDTQIEATEALIAKQERIRAGLMQDLFTRGVDENGELRPPREKAPDLYHETELGWLPRNWQTDCLANLSEKITSGSRDWASYYSLEGATFVRIGNLTRTRTAFRRGSLFQKVAPPKGADGFRTSLRSSDILISITADLGLVGLVPDSLGEAYINQHIAMVRLEDTELAGFTALSLLSKVGQDQFQRNNDPGAKAGLNLPTIERTLVHRAAREEALLIGEIIGHLDSEQDAVSDSLDRLHLWRVGLMQDLLTGTVSVEPLLEKEPA